MLRHVRRALAIGLMLSLTGCGAAYYGGVAIAILLSQGKTTTTDTSFPDAVPTADVLPGFGTLVISSGTVTVEREGAATAPVSTTATTTSTASNKVKVTDFKVDRIDFPAGYGRSQSNRDAATNLTTADRLVIRIDGDAAQAITFGTATVGSDIATTGTAVATLIQTAVRALTPTDPSVSPTSYQLFTASFDPTTGSYQFQSGSAHDRSAVVFEPEKRTGDKASSDAASTTSAKRLGLGVAQGGIETTGADTCAIVVINRGTDVIPTGTKVNLYLSHDKILDKKVDLFFDVIATDQTVAVGEARRFFRRNGNAPPSTILKGDVTAGNWYVIFEVEASGSEKILDNNTVVSSHPIEIYQPIDDPNTQQSEVANALDFVVTNSTSPSGAVTGRNFTVNVTMTNLGSTVPAAGVPIDVDVSLSLDQTFEEPAAIRDPAGVVAGVRVNPTDPNRPITVRVVESGGGPISTTVANDTIVVTYNPILSGPGVTTIASFTTALNAATNSLVDAFADGVGNPATDTLKSLIDRAKLAQVVAKDIFVTTRRATFATANQPLRTQTAQISGPIRTSAFRANLLPLKLTPFVRIRPQFANLGLGTLPENARNNVRQCSFVRVYDRAAAHFDATTGAFLPTVNSDDFAQLDAVSQRPVNTGAIRSGQQRTFSFQIPATGLANDESQLLVIVRASTFDARLDLLSGSGDFLAGSDDSALGLGAPVIYTTVQANSQSRVFYLVLSSARQDDSDLSGSGSSFELTISVNPHLTTDLGLVGAVNGDNVLARAKQRYEDKAPRIENNVLVPFSMATAKSEILLFLPQRARVRFRSRPAFLDGTTTVITQLLAGSVPAPLEFQAEFDPVTNQIVYRPKGGGLATSHVLTEGVYTIAFQGSLPDKQNLRLEVDAEFLPAAETTTTTTR